MRPVLKDAVKALSRRTPARTRRPTAGSGRVSSELLPGSRSRAGSTDLLPNFRVTASRACSAARQLSSRRSRLSCRGAWAASSSCSARMPTSRTVMGRSPTRFQELHCHGVEQLGAVDRRAHGAAAGDGGKIRVAQLERHGAGVHARRCGAARPSGAKAAAAPGAAGRRPRCPWRRSLRRRCSFPAGPGSPAAGRCPRTAGRRAPPRRPAASAARAAATRRRPPPSGCPIRASTSTVLAPTPQSALTGRLCRYGTVSSGPISSRPSGLQRVEAILATNLLAAMPTDAVMPSSRGHAGAGSVRRSPGAGRAAGWLPRRPGRPHPR